MPDRAPHDQSAQDLLGPNGERALAALREAALSSSSDEMSAELKASMCEYVGSLKADGMRAEQAVILLNHTMGRLGLTDPLRGQLKDSIISFCIREFYRQDGPQSP